MLKTTKKLLLVTLTLMLSACNIGGSFSALSVAKKVAKFDGLKQLEVGLLDIASIQKLNEDSIAGAEQLVATPEAFGYAQTDIPAIEDEIIILQYLVDHIGKIDGDGNSPTAEVAYVGSGGSTVTGIYVYKFDTATDIDEKVIDLANSVATKTENYYIFKGHYVFAINTTFIETNNIDLETLKVHIQSLKLS